MNSKTKFGLTITAFVFIAFVLMFSIIAISVYGISKMNNFGFSFKASKVSGFVQAEYSFSGKTTSMTTDGTQNGETILNYNGEANSSTKQLKILDDDTIVLDNINDFVVFEYCFSNTDLDDSFVLYVQYEDNQKTDYNITISWGYSKDQKVDNFDDLENVSDFFSDPISSLSIEPGKTYLYIKAKVTNNTAGAEFSGDFIFQMIG